MTVNPTDTAGGPVVPLNGLYCPGCAYDLRGAAGRRCPECGYDLGYLFTSEVSIPWEHRRRIGRVRAYLQTVWMVTFRHRRFCENYAKRVDYRSARRFQLVTVMLAWLPFVSVVVGFYFYLLNVAREARPVLRSPLRGPATSVADAMIHDYWIIVVLLLGYWLYLYSATAAAAYFCHPRRLSVRHQNTAIALSQYTCGPLAWATWPLCALLHLQMFGPRISSDWLESVIVVIVVIAICLPLSVHSGCCGSLVERIGAVPLPRQIVFMFYLLILHFVLGFAFLFISPLIMILLWMCSLSLAS